MNTKNWIILKIIVMSRWKHFGTHFWESYSRFLSRCHSDTGIPAFWASPFPLVIWAGIPCNPSGISLRPLRSAFILNFLFRVLKNLSRNETMVYLKTNIRAPRSIGRCLMQYGLTESFSNYGKDVKWSWSCTLNLHTCRKCTYLAVGSKTFQLVARKVILCETTIV